ncbi:hypothetical protein, partial [Stenotrophomonas maltophilia group sp. RNC7]
GSLLAVMYWDGLLKLLNTEDGTEAASFSDNMKLYEEEKAARGRSGVQPRFAVLGGWSGCRDRQSV